MWALLSFRADHHRSYLFAAGLVVAAFLSLLMHEAVFFSLCVVGFVIWVKPDFWRDPKSAVVVSLAPLVGALLWGTVYELTKPANPVYAVTEINLRSALSALFYQYRSLEVFDVWTNDSLRNHAISTFQPINLVTVLALCAVPFLVGAILRAARVENDDSVRQQAEIKPIAFLIWMILVVDGGAFIYVLAGGYALDSRKRYILMPMLIMAAAAAIWLIWRPDRARTFWLRNGSVAITAICIFGCLTSLLMTSLWRNEIKRLDLLVELIIENKIVGSLQVDWKPDLKAIWPASEYSWGITAQTVLDEALRVHGFGSVLLGPQSAQRATWIQEVQRWHCCTTEIFSAPSNLVTLTNSSVLRLFR